MKDVMIDIETLATSPTSAVLQIGACVFDAHTGYVSDPFLASVDKAFYENDTPFDVDETTKKWWGKQSAEARKSLDINKVATPFLAMDHFVEWYEEQDDVQITKYRDTSSRVWANPPQFDLNILRHVARHSYGTYDAVPWKYWQETDVRTLRHMGGRVDYADLGERAEGLVPHRADHDAIRQALLVAKLVERIRNGA